jgi:hypothetical protein
MTRKELVLELEKKFEEDEVVVIVEDEVTGGWDNIQEVKYINRTPSITFGGGSPFSDE